MKEIVILHEYGDKRHIRALEYLIDTKYKNNVQLIFREFTPFMGIARSIKHRSLQLFKKQIVNIWNLFSLLVSRDRLIILGIAPYDLHLVILRKILKKHKVFYFTSWPYWDLSFYPKKLFARKQFIQQTWKKFLEDDISGLFTVTRSSCQNIKRYFKIKKPCSVVYHSYDSGIYFPGERFFQDDLTNKKIDCLFVGRLTKEKGVDKILKIIRLLPKNQFRFKFVGKGPLDNNIIEISKKFNSVVYYGFVNNERKLADIYRNSDILLLPSTRTKKGGGELFGMVIIEAMACGNTVISTDHVGPKELVKNGYNGFCFSEGEYVERTIDLLTKLANDVLLLNKLKKNAVKFSKIFAEQKIAKNWDRILREYLQ